MGVALGDRLSLSLSGMIFNVHSPDLPLYEDNDRFTRPFRHKSGCSRETIEVTIRREDFPAEPGGDLLFDAGSYGIYRTGSDRTIVFDPAADGNTPLWSAVISRDNRRIDVAAGAGLLREAEGGTFLETPFRYPLDQLAVIHLLLGRGLLVHAAGAVIGGRGWLFAGVSGAGKTTVTNVIGKTGRGHFLSDDRIVVRAGPSGYEAWGTPWPGEAGTAVNEAAPLGGVFMLVQDTAVSITGLDPPAAARRLIPLVSAPWYDREDLPAALGFLDRLAAQTPFYELRFRPDAGLAEAVEDFCGQQS